MNWVGFGLLSGAVWGTGNILDKFLLDKNLTNPWYFLAVAQTFNAIVGLTIILLWPIDIPSDMWWIVLGAATLNQLGQFFYITALRYADVSQVVPLYIFALFTIPIGDALFLGNIFSVQQYLAMALVAGGGLALVYDKKHGLTKNWRVLVVMGLSISFFSGFWLMGDVLVEHMTSIQHIGLAYLLGSVWVPLFVAIHWGAASPTQRSQRWLKFAPYLAGGTLLALFVSSQLSTAGKMLFTQGLATGTASLVESMTMSQHVLVFLGSAILAKYFPQKFSENITPGVFTQKAISIGVMIIGGLLVLFG